MFTRDELRAVPLFSSLGDNELDYLTNCAADIRVQPGQYVVHEGESRRSLFATIEGRLEATKFVDGVERNVGVRTPGDLFGEVPVVLNTPFLASLRATEPSRVAEIQVKDYHAVAAVAPQIAATLGAAALDRIEGLQEIASEPSTPVVTVIAPQWDPAGHNVREFLRRNSVEFDSITPEEASVNGVLTMNPLSYPLLRMNDGSMLVNPSMRDIANAVGLCVAPKTGLYDVIIIGGGPAGLAAAVYGASEGLTTVLIEREAPGGQAGTSARIENYLGFPFGVSGEELANRALQQAKRMGAEIVVTRRVQHIDAASHTVILDGDEILRGKSIILAPGVTWRRLNIPSIEQYRGRGVYYGAGRGEARLAQGKDVYVIGGGNSAGQSAIAFSNYANAVHLIVRASGLAASMSHYLTEQIKAKSNIILETDSQVVNAYGDEHLEAIDVANAVSGQTARRDAAALFVMIGAYAETAWLPPEIERDPRGYIISGPEVRKSTRWTTERDPFLLETTVPGIFAVGDVRAG